MKHITLIILAGLIILTGCSNTASTDPIQSLEKATISPEREIMFEATKQVWDLQNNQAATNSTGSDSSWNTVGQPNQSVPVVQDSGDITWNFDSTAGNPSQPGIVPETYILQYGETAKCIARRYNVDWITLYSVNNISFDNENNIPAGTVLTIPQNTEWNIDYGPRSSAAHPAVYTVQQGDTFNSIACIFGDVYPESIAQSNSLNLYEQILPGLNLQIQ